MISALVALCVLLALGCAGLVRRLVLSDRWDRQDQLEWRSRVASVEEQRDHAVKALASLHEATRAMLRAVADEAERATGHSGEAFALEALARDVGRASNAFDVVSQDTVAQFARAGFRAPSRPLHLGQAMEMAVGLDHRARRPERGLYAMTRLCLINHTSDEEARWIAEVMALMLRLCHGDEVEARRRFRVAMDLWERTDIYCLASELSAFERVLGEAR